MWDHVPLLVGVVLSLVAIGCIIPVDPEYRDAAAPNSPPYIEWGLVVPKFDQQQSLLSTDRPAFTVTVADIDLGQELLVRFCYRADAEDVDHVIDTYPVGPSVDGKPARKPVATKGFELCRPSGMGTGTHFLWVVVTDGAFDDAFGCDVTLGASDRAFWSYTCQP